MGHKHMKAMLVKPYWCAQIWQDHALPDGNNKSNQGD